MKVIANINVINLITEAQSAATSAHEKAVKAADLALSSYKGAETGTALNESIRKIYQPTLEGKNGAVRDAFYNRVVILCFPKAIVEIPMSKVEIKEQKDVSPKVTKTTKTVAAKNAVSKTLLTIAAKQVREIAGIAKKQPTKTAKVSSIVVSMSKFIADLAVVLKDKDTLAQFKSALEASGFKLTSTRKVVMPNRPQTQEQKQIATLAALEMAKTGTVTRHQLQG